VGITVGLMGCSIMGKGGEIDVPLHHKIMKCKIQFCISRIKQIKLHYSSGIALCRGRHGFGPRTLHVALVVDRLYQHVV
jgi:hypothetical protein